MRNLLMRQASLGERPEEVEGLPQIPRHGDYAQASGAQPVIGVSTHVEPFEPPPIPIHRIDPAVEARQIGAVQGVRASRDGARVGALLDRLAAEARDPTVNLMPTTIELVKARATLGETVARLREVFGRYVEKPVF